MAIFASGIALARDKSESEDQAQYKYFNPRVKPVREVHRKEPTPLQMPDSAVTRWERESLKRLQSLAMIHSERTPVHNVMVKKPYYCCESQPVDEARKIMCEHDLPYLPLWTTICGS